MRAEMMERGGGDLGKRGGGIGTGYVSRNVGFVDDCIRESDMESDLGDETRFESDTDSEVIDEDSD